MTVRKERKHDSHPSSSTFTRAAAAVAVFGALTLGGLGLANAKPADVPKGKPPSALVAQVDNGKPKLFAQAGPAKRLQSGEPSGPVVLPPELANLPKVPLTEIQQQDELSGEYLRYEGHDNAEWRNRFVVVELDGIKITANIILCKTDNCGKTDKVLTGDAIAISVNGQEINGFELKELREAYEQLTGHTLQDSRIVVWIFNSGDASKGTGIRFEVVPVATPDGEIVSGTPTLHTTFYTAWGEMTKPKLRVVD
jgi:hypothetical protein